MNIFWYIGCFSAFLVLGLFGLLYRNIVMGQPNSLRLDPRTIFIASYFLYSSSLPLSRLLFGTFGDELDLTPMRYHLFGFIGIALGSVLSTYKVQKASVVAGAPQLVHVTSPRNSGDLRVGLYVCVMSLLAVRFFWVAFEGLNFDIRNVLQPYGFEQEIGGGGASLLNLFVSFGLVCGLVLGVCWNAHFKPLPPFVRRFVYSLIALFVVFYLLRGSRNTVTLIVLPALGAVFYGRRLGFFRVVSVGLIVVSSFYVLATVRNIGFLNTSKGDVVEIVSSLDPHNGEFGTSYNVLTRALGIGVSGDLLWGRGYTIDPLINMVPRAWWPNRPDNPAIAFSRLYFNTNELTEGLGFSPVLEAYLNFGEFGIILVFALFTMAITILFDQEKRSLRGILLAAFALPIMINWNRIDTSTAFKMYSGYIFMAYLLPAIFIRKRVSVR